MVDVRLGLVVHLGPARHRNVPADSAVLLLPGDTLHRPPCRLGPDAFAARRGRGSRACKPCRSCHSTDNVRVRARHEDLVGILANPKPSQSYRARGHVCGKVHSLWEPLAGLPMVNLIRRIPVCMDISPVIDGPGPEALLRLGFGVWAVVEDGKSIVISIQHNVCFQFATGRVGRLGRSRGNSIVVIVARRIRRITYLRAKAG
mmetsp:Transcript_104047/g.144863  ORF Transcript_104047/g.144863 Transcript_104047/m.144863 type:complete len:203 (-) Transcript_104047:249-857(-)